MKESGPEPTEDENPAPSEVTTETAETVDPLTAIAPGQTVTWADAVRDIDGDPVAFTAGRVLEIEDDAAWVETEDGETDAWIALEHLRSA